MPKPKKRPSIKEQIEKTPKIKDLEMGWFKKKKSPLRESAAKREEESVIFKFPPKPDETFMVHSHPNADVFEQERDPRAYPSVSDLWSFLKTIKNTNPKIRNFVIASISSEGKVIGYTFVRATDDFLKRNQENNFTPEQQKAEEEFWDLVRESSWRTYKKEKVEARRIIHQIEERQLTLLKKLGIRTKFIPAEGYKFDDKKGAFVKK